MKQKGIDMVNGSLWDKILMFALPLAATGILQQLFNAADVAVVGNFTGDKGAACMAAVGANTPIIGFVVNSVVGISLGTNVVIANAVGMNNKDTLSKAVHSSVLFAVLAGIIIGIFGEIFAPQILQSQNVPMDVLPLAEKYLRIYIMGLPVILLYNFEAAIYRGVGDTRTPLIVLTVSGFINVILNLLFVLGFKWNVDGVATATVISNAVSSIVLFLLLLRSKREIRLIPSKIRINEKVLLRILRIGVPSAMQSMAFSFANIIIQSSINSLGTVIMAASSAAFNIEVIAYCVLNSFSQACTTFVGQNFGAGKVDRCRKVLKLCLIEDAFFSLASIGLMLLTGRALLSLFNQDPQVIESGYSRLMIIFTAYIFSMIYENMAGYLRGFGISITPALLTIIGICGVRLAWIFLVFANHHDFKTIMFAYPLSFIVTDIMIATAIVILKPSRRNMHCQDANGNNK